MVANGCGRVLEQPGRKGTGEKLAYTASDGVYVLTGTKAVRRRGWWTEAQGTTTGAALTVQEQGMIASQVAGCGAASAEAKTAGRVHSETTDETVRLEQ